MAGQLSRREFAKLAAGAFCAAGSAGSLSTAEMLVADAPRKLELFNYSGVKLLDGRFKRQYESARNLF